MYLNKKYYVAKWPNAEPKDSYQITIRKGGKFTSIPTSKINYIVTKEIYWRKANAVHQWFVDNVQDGNDDCGRYYVSREQLQELLDICTKILNASELVDGDVNNGYSIENGKRTDHIIKGKVIKDSSVAQENLPTQSGFFFGGTDYDEWYYRDIEHTKKELERVLANKDDDYGEFEYHSSW